MVKWQDFFPNTNESIQNIFGTGKETKDEVDHYFNLGYMYYTKWCYEKIYKLFNFRIPETWDKDYFLTGLFKWGQLGVTDTPAGVLALQCSTAGINVFNRPTTLNFANPVLGDFQRLIDVNCVHLHISPDYLGVNDMVDRYARLLAMCDSSIAVNLQNSKVSAVFFAEDKKQADDMRTMYNQITNGKPAVFVRKSSVSKESVDYNHVKENYVAGDIEELKRQIKNDFLTEIGINAVPYEKKAQINSLEVTSNNQELEINSKYWLDSLKEGFDKANQMFGLSLSVDKVEETPIIDVEEAKENENTKSDDGN